MHKEKNESQLRIPTTFTVSMTRTVAFNRIQAVMSVDGIEFKMLGLTDNNRVIEATLVKTEQGLKAFNKLLQELK